MYRILIFTDSKYRDLPSSVLVQYMLQQKYPDAIIQVCAFNIWKDVIEAFSPHLVILNHILGVRNKSIASYVHRNGGAVAVMYTEGIIEFSGKESVFSLQKDAPNVDLFLCWNKEVSRLVGKKGAVVGSPRFDFYKKPLRALIDSRELFCDKYGLDSNRKIVLLGDSWPSAKFRYSLRNFHRENWVDLGNTVADKWEDPDKFAADQFDAQETFKLYALAAKNSAPGAQVVIKSHPMSDFRRWSHWCNEHGIVLVHGEYIFNVLNAADVYVTKTGSITVAEAWLLGTGVIKLGQEYDSASSLEQFAADDWNIDSLSEFASFLPEALNKKLPSDSAAYLKKWGMTRKGLSARAVTNRIAKLLKEHDPEPIKPPELLMYWDIVAQHSSVHASPRIDSYGNFNKAAVWQDAARWGTGISQLL